ncbi:hypothetical protein [Oricola thermophila]|uniref:Uncharacterized protein n=1 Tax=Oricola thermophila TaxID=2742145 RepID=A0A6N1VGT8_9HYPH|nr:hypothetical protein [Oricola thermophila]QKV20034.1 hypothetical protein HTY61_17045 [Oricola thermophila]
MASCPIIILPVIFVLGTLTTVVFFIMRAVPPCRCADREPSAHAGTMITAVSAVDMLTAIKGRTTA